MKIYAIKDCKIGFSNSIFLKTSDELALRDFTILVNQPGTTVQMFPADFELYCVGDYDQNSGVIISDIRFISNALSLVGKIKFSEDKND